MTDPKVNKPDEWDEAVGAAVDKIAESQATIEAVREKQKPKRSGTLLGICVILLTLVGAWDIWYFTRPPEGLPVEIVAQDLRYSVQFVAEMVEDFRTDTGRLPTVAEIQEELTEGITYAPGEDSFIVTASDSVATVTYHSSVPLQQWVGGAGGAP